MPAYNLSAKQLKTMFFPLGNYFFKTGKCDACKTSIGFRTNGHELFKDNNCRCFPLKPVVSERWQALNVPELIARATRINRRRRYIKEKRTHANSDTVHNPTLNNRDTNNA